MVPEECPRVGLYHSWFIHPPVDGHQDCLQCGPIMSKAAVNIHIHTWTYVSVSLGEVPRSGLCGLHNDLMSMVYR